MCLHNIISSCIIFYIILLIACHSNRTGPTTPNQHWTIKQQPPLSASSSKQQPPSSASCSKQQPPSSASSSTQQPLSSASSSTQQPPSSAPFPPQVFCILPPYTTAPHLPDNPSSASSSTQQPPSSASFLKQQPPSSASSSTQQPPSSASSSTQQPPLSACAVGTAEADTARSSRPPANDARQTRYNGTQTDETFLHHGHHTACSTASTCRTSASSSIVSPYSDDMAKVCSQLSSIADSLNRLTLSSTNTSSKVARDQQNTHITGNKHVTNNRQCPVKKVPLAYLEPHCPPPPFDAPIAPGYGTTAKNAPKRGQQTTHENDCMTRMFASGFAAGVFVCGIIVWWISSSSYLSSFVFLFVLLVLVLAPMLCSSTHCQK
eukprot:GHVQ01042902.1.p1 GENE.GHVQ01042902.1~~GHVQ01042902.1.p1  ORF type:complete len:377 (-),score=97.44 GHVQ01042902.1:783-1913(-)